MAAKRSRAAVTVARGLGAPLGILAVLDGASVSVVSSGPTGHGGGYPHTPGLDTGVGPGDVTAVDRVILVPDLAADPRFEAGCWARMLPHARSLALAPIEGDDGSLLGVLGVIDTQQRAWTPAEGETLAAFAALAAETIEERRAATLLRRMIEQFPNGSLTLFDRDLRVVAGGGRTGPYEAAGLVGKTIAEVMGGELGARLDAVHRAVIETNRPSVEERRVGDWTHLIYRQPTPGEDGSIAGLMAVTQDITERVEMEAALRESEGRHRVLFEKAGAATRQKSAFLANMSHEPRTPLNGIIGFAEFLHDERLGPASAEQKEFLGDILTSARHLHQLINDVLDVAKVEAGKMEFHPEVVDLVGTVREVRDNLRTLAAQKGITVSCEVAPSVAWVTLDPARLKQVLYNYLSNAIKFTPDGGKVTIRALPEGADRVRVEVEDTGIGIDAADVPRLFVEFEQLDTSSTKKYKGTGLGLALTRRLVEAQGGRVEVRSELERGSTFSAILPCGGEGRASAPAAPVSTERPGAPRVLVVEDEADDQTRIVGVLARAGYAVELAASGAEAVERAATRKFDAITLDLRLPDMTGWDVLRAVRADGPNRDAPVVVVTVTAAEGAAGEPAIRDFLVKPIEPSTLLAALQRAGVKPSDPRSVLLVDDDPGAAKHLALQLADHGYRLVHSPGGPEGLRAAAADPPGVVLLDLLMPGMDGLEFLEHFRRTDVGQRTPVIVWTMKDLSTAERTRILQSAHAIVPKGDDAALIAELGEVVSGQAGSGKQPPA